MCAVISLMLWSFFAVVNVRLAARGRRSPLLAMAAWTLVPALIAVVTMLGDQSPIARGTKLMAAAEVALLYLPFRLLAGAAVQTGGSRFAFTGWYLASAAALVIHEVFTAPLDLFRPGHDADVRRTAVMLIANGFLIGVSTLMGLDATRSMNNAVADRAFRRNAAEDDVAARFAYAPPERVNAPTPVPMPTPRR